MQGVFDYWEFLAGKCDPAGFFWSGTDLGRHRVHAKERARVTREGLIRIWWDVDRFSLERLTAWWVGYPNNANVLACFQWMDWDCKDSGEDFPSDMPIVGEKPMLPETLLRHFNQGTNPIFLYRNE